MEQAVCTGVLQEIAAFSKQTELNVRTSLINCKGPYARPCTVPLFAGRSVWLGVIRVPIPFLREEAHGPTGKCGPHCMCFSPASYLFDVFMQRGCVGAIPRSAEYGQPAQRGDREPPVCPVAVLDGTVQVTVTDACNCHSCRQYSCHEDMDTCFGSWMCCGCVL